MPRPFITAAHTALGSELNADDTRHVLSAYVHRYTRTHKPTWARGMWRDGKDYPLQFDSDADWLANTRFAVLRNGRLDHRHTECESRPTWPDNPELRRPSVTA